MNILISGVNGFIGGDLVTYFNQNKDHHVIGIGRRDETPGINYYHADLSDRQSVGKFIEEIRSKGLIIEAFIHCASVLAEADTQKDINLFIQNNLITENAILIVKELGIKTLINLSTIGVYPNSDGEYAETSPVKPSKNFECLYGLAKFCSEELFDFYLLPEKVNVINLRLSQVYGDRMRDDRIYKIMENEMKATGKISVWSNGERVSNFVSIDVVMSAINHFLTAEKSGLFNVGGENISYKQLAEKIIEKNGNTEATVCLVNKGVVSKVYINCDKLRNELKNS
ncbi:MAG: NAD(P)-dependent oxidoreductase [Ferruginibacter sp.]